MPIEKPEGRVCDSKNGPRFRLQERAQRSQQSIWLKEYTMLCCAQFLQSSPTFCDPMDCSPPSSSVHGVLQARKLEWLAMPSSRGSSPARDQTHVSCLAGGVFTAEHRRSPGERYTNLINRKSFPPYYPTRKCSTIFRSQILSLPGTPA